MYDRILASIDEVYVEDACMVLKWLAFSGRQVYYFSTTSQCAIHINQTDF